VGATAGEIVERRGRIVPAIRRGEVVRELSELAGVSTDARARERYLRRTLRELDRIENGRATIAARAVLLVQEQGPLRAGEVLELIERDLGGPISESPKTKRVQTVYQALKRSQLVERRPRPDRRWVRKESA
jgi:hypothetical protein